LLEIQLSDNGLEKTMEIETENYKKNSWIDILIIMCSFIFLFQDAL